MLDPIRKHFGYGRHAARIGPDMAGMQPESGQIWPVCSQNRARSYLPDLTSRILFSSIFPKEAWIILCKTDPDPIWMVLSGFGQTHLVWKQAGAQEPSGPVSGRTQPSRYRFPHSQTRFPSSTDSLAHIVQN